MGNFREKRNMHFGAMEGPAFLENRMAYINHIQNVCDPSRLIHSKPLRIYTQVRNTDGKEEICAEISLTVGVNIKIVNLNAQYQGIT